MAEFREQFITVNDVKLHVVEAGPQDGEVVLFLHGYPEFWYSWRKQLNFFADKGYRAIAPDQRGYNLSDKPEGIDAYQLDKLAGDIAGLIDALGVDQVNLVGHDWGSLVTWWTATRYPEKLKTITTINAPHPYVMLDNLESSVGQLLKSWYALFYQIPGVPEQVMSQDNFARLKASLLGSIPGSFTDEDLTKHVEAWSQPGALTNMVNWYRALIQRRPERIPGLKIPAPALVIWGVHDIYLGQEMASRNADLCMDCRIVYFENNTHWVVDEEPDAINQLILEHVSR